MADDTQPFAQATYECTKKNLYNNTITSPDGSTTYVLETPMKWLIGKKTSLYVINNEEGSSSKTLLWEATWRHYKGDWVTFAGKETIPVNVYLPPKRQGINPTRLLSDKLESGLRWRGGIKPFLTNRDGQTVASWNKKLIGGGPATLRVKTDEDDLPSMADIILGICIMSKDQERRGGG